MNYEYKKAIINAAAFLTFATVFVLPAAYMESRNEKKMLAEKERDIRIEHRLDSLQNIDNLAFRLDGACPDCSYFGGYNWIDSLRKRYVLEGKKLGISFEEYLTNLYVEQQKAKSVKN